MHNSEVVFFEDFIRFLKDKGYPEESIALEYRVDSGSSIDVAILDLDYNTPIQIFELKRIKNPNTIRKGVSQLKRYLKALGNENIPAYLVFPEGKDFEIIRANDYSLNVNSDENTEKQMDERSVDSFALNYNGQRVSRRAESINGIKKKKDKSIDFFKITCFVLAFILIVLLIMKWMCYIYLDNNDLALLGGIIVLFLVPSAQKIKILGIEYEKAVEKKENDEKNMKSFSSY